MDKTYRAVQIYIGAIRPENIMLKVVSNYSILTYILITISNVLTSEVHVRSIKLILCAYIKGKTIDYLY